MDSHQPQPGSKRGNEVMSMQNQKDEMSSSSTEGEEGAETKRFKQELHPLQMGAVLEQIFSNLDPKSIKNARQVNPLWSAEGAKMLMTKCYVKIPSDIHDGDFINRVMALDEFKAFLSHKSSAFSTIANITVNGADDVKVWKYLGVLGQQVKSLKINNIPSENEYEFFKNLVDLLPSLGYLKLSESYCAPKTIRVLASVMSTSEKDRNSLVIPCLCLYLDNMEKLEDIEKFASCKTIMIEKLKINMDPFFLEEAQDRVVRVARILSTILSTSQNILKDLNLIDFHPILPLLEFPCMTALTHIDLGFESEIADQLLHCKFSPSFRFLEKVPKLQEVRIGEPMSDDPSNYVQVVRHCFTRLFKTAGIALSVKSVYCWGSVSDFDVYHIFKTFPNIVDFGTDLSWKSSKMLRSLWKHGRNLKELVLYADFYSPLDRIGDLDSSFTGLPVWVVDEIKKTQNLDRFSVEDLEELRVESSILNLKELKKLVIHFRGSWERDVPKRVLAVAGKYAFSLLPKIVISIEELEVSIDINDVSKLSNVEISGCFPDP